MPVGHSGDIINPIAHSILITRHVAVTGTLSGERSAGEIIDTIAIGIDEAVIDAITILVHPAISMAIIGPITIGKKVEEMHQNDWNAEDDVIKKYNATIRLAAEVGDNGTKTMLEEILKDEENHIDWLEEQQDQIDQ
ncbi:MAG: hypothetical protein IH613_10930, partial [Desulfuromonadales bacterium]|nr:hypothetical protein [Desulfuromonadales bacterium]